MTLKKKLTALLREIIAEADTNPEFRDRLDNALVPETKPSNRGRATPKDAAKPQHQRPSNRRTSAIIDPVQLAREGESALRTALAELDIEQLRDVVAEYGMDTGKLVMKWRDTDRIVERIVEVARGRAQKGSAFRPQSDSGDQLPDDTHGHPPDGGEAELPSDDDGQRPE